MLHILAFINVDVVVDGGDDGVMDMRMMKGWWRLFGVLIDKNY
jgi:hypothetical protein